MQLNVAWSLPVNLGTVGPTWSMAPYEEETPSVSFMRSDDIALFARSEAAHVPPKPVSLLPLKNSWHVGRLASPVALKKPTFRSTPLFIVGSDPASLAWMKAHETSLKKSHALGLLVQAETMGDIKKMAVAAHEMGLILTVAQGDAWQSEVSVYPVLISSTEVVQ